MTDPPKHIVDKLAEAKELGDRFRAAKNLQERFPGIFEEGAVNLRLYSEGSMGKPMVEIMRLDGESQRVPLLELPMVVIKDFSETVEKMGRLARTKNAHRHWLVALKLITGEK